MKYPKDRSAKIKPFKQWFKENHPRCKAGQPGCREKVEVTQKQYDEFEKDARGVDTKTGESIKLEWVHFMGHDLVVV